MSMQSAVGRRSDISLQPRRPAHPVAVSGHHVRAKPLAPLTSEEFSEPDLDLVTRAEWAAPDAPESLLEETLRLLTDRESTISALDAHIHSLTSRMADVTETLRRREAELAELRELLRPAPAEPSDAEDEHPSLRRISIRTRADEGQSESLSVACASEYEPSAASELEFGDEARFFAGITQDMQRGGLFLPTHEALPIGSRLDLEFELPEGTSVRASGVVAWIRETTGPDSARPGVGVAFTKLPPESLPAIERFCRIHPPLYIEF